MDLESIGKEIAEIGLPILGDAIPLPGAGAVCGALAHYIGAPSSKPEDILQHLKENPALIEKAKEFELQNHTTLVQIQVHAELEQRAADSTDISNVNKTMQAEDNSATGSAWWRDACGYIVAFGSGISLLAVIGIAYLTVFSSEPNATKIIGVLPSLIMGITTILAIPGAAVGITAWHHGQVDRINASKGIAGNE